MGQAGLRLHTSRTVLAKLHHAPYKNAIVLSFFWLATPVKFVGHIHSRFLCLHVHHVDVSVAVGKGRWGDGEGTAGLGAKPLEG